MAYNVQWGQDSAGNPCIVSVTHTPDETHNSVEEFIQRYSTPSFNFVPAGIIAELEKNKHMNRTIESVLAKMKSAIRVSDDPPKASPGSSVVEFSKFLEGAK